MSTDKKYLDLFELNNNSYDSFNICYNYILDKLETIFDENFDSTEVINLRPIFFKYMKIGRALGGDEGLLNDIEIFSQQFVGNIMFPNDSIDEKTKIASFHSIRTTVINLKTDIQNKINLSEDFPIQEIINPNFSDKSEAANLILQAIDIILNSITINTKSKERLIKYLNEAILELNREKTNWTFYFSKVDKILITLGALCTIVSNVISTCDLFEAKTKIEEANKIIQNTSINLNPGNIKSVININKSYQLIDNQLILKDPNDKK
ncbi:MAG: hypothetical protein JXB00_00085 [Bacteroidales bacterium]|nr:hypothetical protein [Bacteroidales bacterium]